MPVTITTRQSQLTELTHAQVDQNFSNLKQAVDANTGAIGTYAQSGGAASIGVTPVGGIASTNVQAALAELDAEKAPLANPTFSARTKFGVLGASGQYALTLNPDTAGYSAYHLKVGTVGNEALMFCTGGDAYTLFIERMRLDNAGNLMLGSTSAINASRDVITAQRDQNGPTYVMINNQSTGAGASVALDLEAYGGSWQIQVPGSATYQNPLIFASTHSPAGEKMRLTHDGNLLVGVGSGSSHRIYKGVVDNANGTILGIEGSQGVAYFYGVSGGALGNNASAALKMNRDANTGRSINTYGTINASGADYAEYMTKAETCGVIAKGQIVGVDVQGMLTDKWADAVSFLIKSTDPSYVGGDVWGTDEALGVPRPVEPVFDAPEHDEDGAQVAAARESFDSVTMPAYRAALADFEAKLEAARQRVDRIAYCGQVPVNVIGATPGQYVVPQQDGEGIGAVLVARAEMTLDQYMMAVGVVQNILPDGRANVRVKVV